MASAHFHPQLLVQRSVRQHQIWRANCLTIKNMLDTNLQKRKELKMEQSQYNRTAEKVAILPCWSKNHFQCSLVTEIDLQNQKKVVTVGMLHLCQWHFRSKMVKHHMPSCSNKKTRSEECRLFLHKNRSKQLNTQAVASLHQS